MHPSKPARRVAFISVAVLLVNACAGTMEKVSGGLQDSVRAVSRGIGTVSEGIGEGLTIVGSGLGEGVTMVGSGLGEGLTTVTEGLGAGVSTVASGISAVGGWLPNPFGVSEEPGFLTLIADSRSITDDELRLLSRYCVRESRLCLIPGPLFPGNDLLVASINGATRNLVLATGRSPTVDVVEAIQRALSRRVRVAVYVPMASGAFSDELLTIRKLRDGGAVVAQVFAPWSFPGGGEAPRFYEAAVIDQTYVFSSDAGLIEGDQPLSNRQIVSMASKEAALRLSADLERLHKAGQALFARQTQPLGNDWAMSYLRSLGGSSFGKRIASYSEHPFGEALPLLLGDRPVPGAGERGEIRECQSDGAVARRMFSFEWRATSVAEGEAEGVRYWPYVPEDVLGCLTPSGRDLVCGFHGAAWQLSSWEVGKESPGFDAAPHPAPCHQNGRIAAAVDAKAGSPRATFGASLAALSIKPAAVPWATREFLASAFVPDGVAEVGSTACLERRFYDLRSIYLGRRLRAPSALCAMGMTLGGAGQALVLTTESVPHLSAQMCEGFAAACSDWDVIDLQRILAPVMRQSDVAQVSEQGALWIRGGNGRSQVAIGSSGFDEGAPPSLFVAAQSPELSAAWLELLPQLASLSGFPLDEIIAGDERSLKRLWVRADHLRIPLRIKVSAPGMVSRTLTFHRHPGGAVATFAYPRAETVSVRLETGEASAATSCEFSLPGSFVPKRGGLLRLSDLTRGTACATWPNDRIAAKTGQP